MKSTELRIGNLLRYTDYTNVKEQLRGTPFELTADDILFLSENSVHYVDPIQLTEEWLIKLGFVKHSGGYLSSDSAIELTFDFLVWKPNIKRLKILYVHQLQNLYFAITGQELSV